MKIELIYRYYEYGQPAYNSKYTQTEVYSPHPLTKEQLLELIRAEQRDRRVTILDVTVTRIATY